MSEQVSHAVRATAAWLNAHRRGVQGEMSVRILKVMEEIGEAVEAWSRNEPYTVVAAELGDVALTALVAIQSIDPPVDGDVLHFYDAREVGPSMDRVNDGLLLVFMAAGQVASAWVGATGQNPRKGYTHILSDVAAALQVVVIHALGTIELLGRRDPHEVLDQCAAKVLDRIGVL